MRGIKEKEFDTIRAKENVRSFLDNLFRVTKETKKIGPEKGYIGEWWTMEQLEVNRDRVRGRDKGMI